MENIDYNTIRLYPGLFEFKLSADYTTEFESPVTDTARKYIFSENASFSQDAAFNIEECDIDFLKDVNPKLNRWERGDRTSGYSCYAEGKKLLMALPKIKHDNVLLKCEFDSVNLGDVLRYLFTQKISNPFLNEFIYKFDYEKIPKFDSIQLSEHSLPAYFAYENFFVKVRPGLPDVANQKIFIKLRESAPKNFKPIDVPDKSAIFVMRTLANAGPLYLNFIFYESLKEFEDIISKYNYCYKEFDLY